MKYNSTSSNYDKTNRILLVAENICYGALYQWCIIVLYLNVVTREHKDRSWYNFVHKVCFTIDHDVQNSAEQSEKLINAFWQNRPCLNISMQALDWKPCALLTENPWNLDKICWANICNNITEKPSLNIYTLYCKYFVYKMLSSYIAVIYIKQRV